MLLPRKVGSGYLPRLHYTIRRIKIMAHILWTWLETLIPDQDGAVPANIVFPHFGFILFVSLINPTIRNQGDMAQNPAQRIGINPSLLCAVTSSCL